MMLDRGSLGSYALYGAATLTAGSVSKNATINAPSAGYAPVKTEVPPWLSELAPDLVSTGALYVRDGSLFLYGLGVLEVFSMFAVIVTLIITVAKLGMDVVTFRMNKRKIEAEKRAFMAKCPTCGYDPEDPYSDFLAPVETTDPLDIPNGIVEEDDASPVEKK